jgi:hypothetical protein
MDPVALCAMLLGDVMPVNSVIPMIVPPATHTPFLVQTWRW